MNLGAPGLDFETWESTKASASTYYSRKVSIATGISCHIPEVARRCLGRFRGVFESHVAQQDSEKVVITPKVPVAEVKNVLGALFVVITKR